MSCPNGYICLDKVNGLLILSLCLVILYAINKDSYRLLYSKIKICHLL